MSIRGGRNPTKAARRERESIGGAEHLVIFQERQRQPDGEGGAETKYAEVSRSWAHVRSVQGENVRRADRETPEATHEITPQDDVEIPANGRVRLPETGDQWAIEAVLREPGEEPVVQVRESRDLE